MIKKVFSFKIILLLALFTGIMSCDKDNSLVNDQINDRNLSDDIDLGEFTADIADFTTDEPGDLDPEGMFPTDRKRCFTFAFPISMVFPGGEIKEFSSREEMGTALREWRQANPGVHERPEFQFPITVTLPDDSTKVFESKEDLADFLKNCRGDRPNGDKPNRCFKPVLPFSIMFPDSTTQLVNDKEELITAIQEWRQNNPGVPGRPDFVFPIDVELRDGTVVTINNKGELLEILKKCHKRPKHKPHFGRCFNLVYPVTILFPDGTSQEVNSKEEIRNILMEWKQNNPDSHKRPHIAIPFDVETKNGKVITINNKEDLIKLMRKCKGKRKGGKGKGGRGHGNG